MGLISPLELVLIVIVCALILIVDYRYGNRGLIGAFKIGLLKGYRSDVAKLPSKGLPKK